MEKMLQVGNIVSTNYAERKNVKELCVPSVLINLISVHGVEIKNEAKVIRHWLQGLPN